MKNRKYKTGLVVGKFLPFHLGHQFLIGFALKRVDKLWVMVCQTKRYDIPAKTRLAFIKEIFPNIEGVIVRHPARLDNDTTVVSQEWAKLTVDRLGFIPEVVFSSEMYGQKYAEYMGSTHVMVDQKRKHIPISGTKIRDDIWGNWNYLTSPAKEYLARRVVILGAESTGTTTLAEDLSGYYKTSWVPEYGRIYYEGKMKANEGSSWNSDEFVHIATQQKRMEDFLARSSNGLLICDTDPWVTRIWHERYVGNRLPELDRLTREDKKPLYILTGTDIPFVQDGTRDGEHIRNWMHDLFKRELKQTGRKFITVYGNRQERLNKAVDMIDTIIFNNRK